MPNGVGWPTQRPPAGIAFWIVFLAFVAVVTHPSWVEHWERKDTLDSLVALGTLALAVVTAASVRLSRAASAQEHVRHRQRLMPMIRIGLAVDPRNPQNAVGLTAKNIGLGPALHIDVRAEFLTNAPPPMSGKTIRDAIAGLGVGEERQIRHRLQNVPYTRRVYGKISVRYKDVFRNPYSTMYEDFGQLKFTYKGPDD